MARRSCLLAAIERVSLGAAHGSGLEFEVWIGLERLACSISTLHPKLGGGAVGRLIPRAN